MTFANLSQSMQDIVLFNFGYTMKTIFIFLMISISIFYLFIYKPNYQKPTIFMSVFIFRVILMGYSFILLVMSPFILLMLDPNYSFSSFFTIFAYLYTINFILIGLIISLDFLRYAPVWVMKIGGINLDSENGNKLQSWVRRNFGNR